VQFLLEGMRNGERGLYISLSENRWELNAILNSHGWPVDQFKIYEMDVVGTVVESASDYSFFHPAELELSDISKSLRDEIANVKPSRLVFDSLSELRLLARDPLRFRREILRLKSYLIEVGCTVLFLDGRSTEDQSLQLHSTVSTVIKIDQKVTEYGAIQRSLTVTKMRASDFKGGRHDFRIVRGGVRVFPRLSRKGVLGVEDSSLGRGQRFVSTGLTALDVILAGGFRSGSSNIIEGAGGSGKSSVAVQYAQAAALRGEKVAVLLFDESLSSYLERTSGLGLDFREFIDSGLILIRHIDPAEISPGEFANVAMESARQGCSAVIIDSLNGFINAMPSENFLILQMQELIAHLTDLGVILVVITYNPVQNHQSTLASIDLSYLADVVIRTGFYLQDGVREKYLQVIKNRSGGYDASAYELKISSDGVVLGAPLHVETVLLPSSFDAAGPDLRKSSLKDQIL
jgi:circadian clock protein KaiC